MIAPIRLTSTDVERYARLRRRMLEQAPWAFSSHPDDPGALDLARLAARLDEVESATFAFEAPPSTRPSHRELVAAAGIVRAKQIKHAHRAMIWGVFVEPAHRGQGMGRALMTAAIATARAWPGVDYLDLGVSEGSPEALRLYESLGFLRWGREPEATRHDGRSYDEIHMTFKL